jgi:peroxiredoxin
MRKLIFLTLIFTLSLSSCKRNNTFIEGNIKMGAKKMLYLDYLNINKTESIDSLKIKKNGLFKFSINIDSPGIYLLRNDKGDLISLLPHPGEKLIIETNYDNFDKLYSVSGSKESEYIRQLVEKLNDTRERLKKLDDALESLSNTNEDQARDYINRRKDIIKEQRDFSIHFIIEHLNSIASIYALYQTISQGQYVLGQNSDIQYMKIVADSVSVRYPEAPFVRSFVEDARSSEQKFYNLKSLNDKMSSIGVSSSNMLDLIIPDINGDSISLKSLKGKVVLLYFWASQSEGSSEMNQSLKKIYDRNHEKGFEVYAVALEKNEELWKKTVRFEELDWINVNELSFPESRAAVLYNVKSLPTSYLINKQGDIVARDIYGSELQKWLDNLL